MRVIAGELGGRQLRAPRSGGVRPTADRVREALFSILGDIEGSVALDLYCGTGALGIEAISRGAAAVTFVDTDVRPAADNVEALGIEDRAELIRSDALRFLERETGSFDLIFCDPPYSSAAHLGTDLDSLLAAPTQPGGSRDRGDGGCRSHRPVAAAARRAPLRIHRDPHPRSAGEVSAEQRMTAVCPGSYDPVTNGHIDIISRTARIFEHVIVGVVDQPLRKQKTLFTADERKGFIERATTDLDNVEVKVFSTLLVEFAKENGAGTIVKGLRAISDFEYEFEMNQLNRKLDPDIESAYVMASAEYSFLSSTGVKELATFGGNVSDLVPDEVAKALSERIER